jgi:hypothetical protein
MGTVDKKEIVTTVNSKANTFLSHLTHRRGGGEREPESRV